MSIEDLFISGEQDSPLLQDKEEKPERFGRVSAYPKTVALVGTCCGLLALFGMLPKSATGYLSSIFLRTNQGANTIEICVQEMILVTPQPAQDAIVHCWDKDLGVDDLMAEGRTGSDGCARLTYAEDSWDNAVMGSSPDIYCTVDKNSFLEAAPPRLDHHDQSTLAKMEDVTLYRDRRNDYGHDNGCGPLATEFLGVNEAMAWYSRFRDQCTHHDKCYWDCQVFLAKGNAEDAKAFCDNEMLDGMRSMCHVNRGGVIGSETRCLARAGRFYQYLQIAGDMAYDKTNDICPNINGERCPSMDNDYSHPTCLLNGFQCGYDGSTGDDLDGCNECCNVPQVVVAGTVWNDHYCNCLPAEVKCGTTLVGSSFDNCDQCCNPGKTIQDGWIYDDYHCDY